MRKVVNNFLKKNGDSLYFVFRVLVGLLFLQHGAQKLFGALGGTRVELISLMGLAGFIEFFGGILIALGLLTQLVSLIVGIEMLTAYFMAHMSRGMVPILNGGELSLLFFASFLVLMAKGSGKWALCHVLIKNH